MEKYLQIYYRAFLVLLLALNLTGCPSATPEPEYPSRPPEALADGNVAIELPDYFIAGQPYSIKLKLSGRSSYTIRGNLYVTDPQFNQNGSELGDLVNNYPITLDTSNPEAIISFVPRLNGPTWDSYGVTATFKGNDSDNYTLTVKSKQIPKYERILSAGSAETIVAKTEKRLSAKTNYLLEQQIGEISNIAWKQIEGPTVNLSQLSIREVSFIAPDVTTTTKLRFEITAPKGHSGQNWTAEKVIYVVPTNEWVKVVKISSDGTIAVREDNSAVVAYGGSEYLNFILPRPYGDIKNIVNVYYEQWFLNNRAVVILYKDGTIDAIAFDDMKRPQFLFEDRERKPISGIDSYSLNEALIFRANDIKDVGVAPYDSFSFQTWDDKVFSFVGNDGFSEIRNTVTGYTLNDEGVLSGDILVNSYGRAPFSLKNIASFSPQNYSDFRPEGIGYISMDNQVGFLSALPSEAVDVGPKIQNEVFTPSPFQKTPFVQIAVKGRYYESFLLEKNGELSSYYKGRWQAYPYYSDIAELGNVALTKDGRVVLFEGTYQAAYVGSYLAKVSTGELPSPYNIKAIISE
ncbi:MAG TPA: hypothetical protein PKD17_12295 [Cellvibrionaceae bacterium]|nr:hypothetical protein [Cellvibrionaceae bacterium]HMW72599.1 hypothetical protein [Cellvibrionaceae bacterium]HMY37902.1 hypothetical protein [Marinagarivorans sp.]HNG58490.1 hypothetical protein [Cellvibrionaceae bacterium]